MPPEKQKSGMGADVCGTVAHASFVADVPSMFTQSHRVAELWATNSHLWSIDALSFQVESPMHSTLTLVDGRTGALDVVGGGAGSPSSQTGLHVWTLTSAANALSVFVKLYRMIGFCATNSHVCNSENRPFQFRSSKHMAYYREKWLEQVLELLLKFY